MIDRGAADPGPKWRLRWLLQIGSVELAQITRHALIDLRQPALHLGAREVLVTVVDRLELAAVDRDARQCQQAQLPAKNNELSAHLADGGPVILAEIGNRLVIGNEAAGQPQHFNIATSLALQPTARLNPIAGACI